MTDHTRTVHIRAVQTGPSAAGVVLMATFSFIAVVTVITVILLLMGIPSETPCTPQNEGPRILYQV